VRVALSDPASARLLLQVWVELLLLDSPEQRWRALPSLKRLQTAIETRSDDTGSTNIETGKT
jgi:hypothetical protein